MTALTRHIPPAANRVYKMGEKILVYSENEKRWVGSLIVVDITGRMITVQTPDETRLQTFNSFHNKLYYRSISFNFNKFITGNNSPPLFRTYQI